jgi:hypothetical protein
MKNKIMTSNNQVCVCVQQNILNAKKQKIKKPLRGSQTQEIHYPNTNQVTKHSYSQNPLQ